MVSEFNYLGIILDSKLKFKKHIKKVINTVKFSLFNFRFIRPYLSTEAALLYMHTMIFSHLLYCITSWSQTGSTTFHQLDTLYKHALKTLDKKPFWYHHCHIISKYNLFTLDNFKNYNDACLIFKILHGLAPPTNVSVCVQKSQ